MGIHLSFHYHIPMDYTGAIIGPHMQKGMGALAGEMTKMGDQIYSSVHSLVNPKINEAVKEVVSEIGQMSARHQMGIMDAAQMFGESYHSALIQATNKAARVIQETSQTCNEAIVRGQTMLGNGFHDSGVTVSAAMDQSTLTLGDAFTEISIERSIDVAQTLGVIIMLIVPIVLLFTILSSKKTFTERRKALGWASMVIFFVFGALLIGEFAFACFRGWMLRPDQYFLLVFLAFSTFSSFMVIFGHLVMWCVNKYKGRRRAGDQEIPTNLQFASPQQPGSGNDVSVQSSFVDFHKGVNEEFDDSDVKL